MEWILGNIQFLLGIGAMAVWMFFQTKSTKDNLSKLEERTNRIEMRLDDKFEKLDGKVDEKFEELRKDIRGVGESLHDIGNTLTKINCGLDAKATVEKVIQLEGDIKVIESKLENI